MLAEIHRKISRTYSNLSQISEDELTGNFFGHLRYLPFCKGLKPLLQACVFPPELAVSLDEITTGYWNDNIEFWPYDKEGELDIYLEFDHLALGIEVKYKSGFSSEDGSEPTDQSRHQLQREARILARRAEDKEKVLLLIGDGAFCADTYTKVTKRKLFSGLNLSFGYVTWQGLLRELYQLSFPDPFSALIVSDLIALLKRKGFDQFHTMEPELPFLVSGQEYFRFDGGKMEEFSFHTEGAEKVKGDSYYEFR